MSLSFSSEDEKDSQKGSLSHLSFVNSSVVSRTSLNSDRSFESPWRPQSMKTMFVRHRLKGGKANVATLSSSAVRMVARAGRHDSDSSSTSTGISSSYSTAGSVGRIRKTLSERRNQPRVQVNLSDEFWFYDYPMTMTVLLLLLVMSIGIGLCFLMGDIHELHGIPHWKVVTEEHTARMERLARMLRERNRAAAEADARRRRRYPIQPSHTAGHADSTPHRLLGGRLGPGAGPQAGGSWSDRGGEGRADIDAEWRGVKGQGE